MWKYQQIKERALVWWKLKLSVVDEPMEKEESETLAKKKKKKKLQWKRYFSKGKYQIFLEARSFSKVQKKTDYEISLRQNNVNKMNVYWASSTTVTKLYFSQQIP